MIKFTIKRVSYKDYGTFGVFLDNNDEVFAITLERPWLNNKKGESCIPEGLYKCKRVKSPKFGNTFEVTHVPNRSSILLHKGNLKDDSHGCILVAEQFERLGDKQGVISSKKGFDEFLSKVKSVNEFNLEILKRD